MSRGTCPPYLSISMCESAETLRALVGASPTVRIKAENLFHGQLRHGPRVRRPGEQRGGHHVDARIGGLRRHQHRNQQSERVAVIERDGRRRVQLGQLQANALGFLARARGRTRVDVSLVHRAWV